MSSQRYANHLGYKTTGRQATLAVFVRLDLFDARHAPNIARRRTLLIITIHFPSPRLSP